MKPTLFVLAAGMGSRYGGIKQLDKLGPAGETIIDYSIYDAVNAGFGKIVFVIRKSIEADFKEVFMDKYAGKIKIEYVLQETDKVPAGAEIAPDRTKPWGTAHAVLMGNEVINEPFAVINGDDFYGADGFRRMAKALTEGKKDECLMVGYVLDNTLSEHGYVSRGVCAVDKEGYLTDVVERTQIMRTADGVEFKNADGTIEKLDEKAIVSMNFWGFMPEFYSHLQKEFENFIAENGKNLKAEFYIPTVVNNLMKSGKLKCKVLNCTDKWFGVTYIEDRPVVVEKLKKLTDTGAYPSPLF